MRLADAGKDAPKAPARFAQPCARISRFMSGRAPPARAVTASSRLPSSTMAEAGTISCCRRAGSRLGSAPAGHPFGTPARSRTSGRPLAWLRPDATAKPAAPATATSAAGTRGDSRRPKATTATVARVTTSAGTATSGSDARTARSSDTRPPLARTPEIPSASSSCIAAISRPAAAVKPTSTDSGRKRIRFAPPTSATDDADGPGQQGEGGEHRQAAFVEQAVRGEMRRERRQDQEAGRVRRPRDDLRALPEEGRHQSRHRGRGQAVGGRQARHQRVGQALRQAHQGDGEPGLQVPGQCRAERRRRSAGRGARGAAHRVSRRVRHRRASSIPAARRPRGPA